METGPSPGLVELVGALTEAIDRPCRAHRRTDGPWRDGAAGGCGKPLLDRRTGPARALRATPDDVKLAVGRFSGKGALRRAGAGFLLAADVPIPRLLPEPRTLKSRRSGAAFQVSPGALGVQFRAGPPLPRDLAHPQGICRRMVLEEELREGFDARRGGQVRLGRLRKNSQGAAEEAGRRWLSVSSFAVARRLAGSQDENMLHLDLTGPREEHQAARA